VLEGFTFADGLEEKEEEERLLTQKSDPQL
jgi:hypothetical protein